MRLHGRTVNALKVMSAALAAAGLLVAALVVTAGGRTSPPREMLVVAVSAEPRSLDPHATTASSDFQVLANIYEGLVRFADGTLTPVPGLAERWTIADDGTTYTFYLRQGVRFHDGSMFDAHSVVFNLERMLDKEHPYHHTGPFPLAFFFERVQHVRAMDAHTVQLVLDEPFAPLLANLAYPTGYIISPQAVRARGAGIAEHPVGTGPFRFERWDSGRRIVLSRFDARGAAAPALAVSQLVFRPIADPMTRVAELSAGSVDLVPELNPDQVAEFRRTPGFEVVEAAGPHLWFVILDTRRPPFDDVRVRRAVNYAVDKRALVRDVLQGTATVAAGPIAAAFGDAAGDVDPYAYDPRQARELLAEAGIRKGTVVKLAAPTAGSGMLAPLAMATAIQADLAAVGLDVSVETYEWNAYLKEVNAGLTQHHMAQMAWMTNDPDTLPFLSLRRAAWPPAGFNSGWYDRPELDELLHRARVELEPARRAFLYAEVQRLVHDDAPWLFVASSRKSVVFAERLEGPKVQPSFLLGLEGVTKR